VYLEEIVLVGSDKGSEDNGVVQLCFDFRFC